MILGKVLQLLETSVFLVRKERQLQAGRIGGCYHGEWVQNMLPGIPSGTLSSCNSVNYIIIHTKLEGFFL